MEKAIIVNDVTKKYKLYESSKERILDMVSPKGYGEDFYALANVKFEAEKGETIGFIGTNGSGKSTLSNIIAGIVPETSGTVQVNGQTSLIAVAAGLKGDLTGRDNIELKCLMLGFSKEEIKALEPSIIEFSELGKFIDQPVNSYSSGMRSRLGFSISVNVDPDILIIDEALSVGDKAFAEKCLDKMNEFKQSGKTIIFVSHSVGQMKQFCEKILWLEYGMVKDYGPVKEIMPKYETFLNQWKKMSKKERDEYRSTALKHQQQVLQGSMNYMEHTNIPVVHEDVDQTCEESLTSLVGQINNNQEGKYNLYSYPTEAAQSLSSKKLLGYVFYIKKKAEYKKELFYLLSTEPSAINGVIGWVKATDVNTHRYVDIDNDPKEFYLTGAGFGYAKAWGGRKDRVFSSLKSYKDSLFKVNKTVMVGSNVWYRGILDGKETWVHSGRVK